MPLLMRRRIDPGRRPARNRTWAVPSTLIRDTLAKIYDSSGNDISEKLSDANPMIEVIALHQDVLLERYFGRSELVFILRGNLALSGVYEERDRKEWVIPEGHMALIPGGTNVFASSGTGALVLTVRLKPRLQIPYLKPLLDLGRDADYDSSACFSLPMEEELLFSVTHMARMLEKGHNDQYYLDLKASEVFYMVRKLYPESQQARLLAPILSDRISFHNMVVSNFDKVKTVGDYARIGGYSLSSFEKQFRVVFGVSPYRWMLRRKMELLYNALTMTDKSLKEISDEFGFSSLSQMNDFCKKHIGATPGNIHKGLFQVDPSIFGAG